jgi:hypothetical protein
MRFGDNYSKEKKSSVATKSTHGKESIEIVKDR